MTTRAVTSGVCLLSGEFPPDAGGVGDYTACLGEALSDLGVPVRVLTRARPSSGRWRRSNDADRSEPTLEVQRAVAGWDMRAWWITQRVLARLGPHPVLHIQYQAGAFDLGGWVNLLPLWTRLAAPRARVVTTFHDFRSPYLFPKAGRLRLSANRLLARTSHAAIFAEPVDLAAAGPGVKGFLIPIGSNVPCAPPTGYDRAMVRKQLGSDESTTLVGYFGFLNSSKGVPSLLRAVGSLVAEGRPIRLAVLGAEAGASDPTDLAQAREVRNLIARMSLQDRVTLTGFLAPPELSATLLACDVVALPFLDGASMRRGTLMAAIAHGVPIVTTVSARNVVGRPLDFRDGENMLQVPAGDADALARAVARLADDPRLRARLRAGSHELATHIAWPTIAKATLEVYADLYPRHPSSASNI